MLEEITIWLVQTIGDWGYSGITILMFLESSFFPFPSEIVITPAGYLASKHDLNLWLIILSGTGGSLLGAIFNYWLALYFGRPFLFKYGKYFFITKKSLSKADLFFDRHGHISTFVARLLPGIRQYISLPAGLAKMSLGLFCLFTTLGAGIWVTTLALLGYLFGHNQELITSKLHFVLYFVAIICLIIIVGYVLIYRKRRLDQQSGQYMSSIDKET